MSELDVESPARSSARSKWVQTGIRGAFAAQDYFVYGYLFLIAVAVVTFFALGSETVLAKLVAAAEGVRHSAPAHGGAEGREKTQKFFLLLVNSAAIFLCLPLLPILVLTGFLLRHFLHALLVNATALCVASFGQYLLARTHHATITEQLQLRFATLYQAADLIRSESGLVFLFRFATIPVFAKNFLAGALNFDVYLFGASVAAHACYLGALCGYVGVFGRGVLQQFAGKSSSSRGAVGEEDDGEDGAPAATATGDVVIAKGKTASPSGALLQAVCLYGFSIAATALFVVLVWRKWKINVMPHINPAGVGGDVAPTSRRGDNMDHGEDSGSREPTNRARDENSPLVEPDPIGRGIR
mmetsp:Transcript_12313/g.29890  ORF Transcript_12313/g.29890 Transcript_12313/m.29890 type:complete len:356 (+) Transcript_12313:154-1221(+)|eukprot:CAMPEP_0178988170 /NCGR_PEP_ID=MMETSP0795-20121207/3669_1 /TAXON_ID=88552 /ORGANISM="Amoebophrya sp., Strain Ameob2" /LENGTH=355 /DNA_ID=CAMNT_0020679429 /DNA_START=141 /DNA_END=1208 /DNA_ORIENTATION=-